MSTSWAGWAALETASPSLLLRGPPPPPARLAALAARLSQVRISARPGGRQRLPGPAQARGTALFEWNWVDFALAYRGCSVEERDRVLPETADGEVEPELVFLWGGRVWRRGRGRRFS